MSAPVTYRELLDEAGAGLTGIHALVRQPFLDPDDADRTAVAWRWLVATAVRHAALLAPADELVVQLPRLHPARGRVRAGDPLHPAGRALLRSAGPLGLAHDLLASHLGPERQRLTPDAVLIETVGPTSPALATVTSMLLTAAVAHHALARRMAEVQPDSNRTPPPVTRLLREGLTLLAPAARLDDRLRGTTDAAGDPLAALTPAPALTEVPLSCGDPLAESLSRLRLGAHRQGTGQLPAGAATMRALSLVAATQLRCDLDQARAARRPPTELSRIVSAGRSWWALHRAWSQVRTLTAGSRGLLHDAHTTLQLLGADAPPSELVRLDRTSPRGHADWLSGIATAMTEATRLLAEQGLLLVPTRWCEDADITRRWTPAWPEHVDRLAGLTRTAGDLASPTRRSSWASGSTLTRQPAADQVLARTS